MYQIIWQSMKTFYINKILGINNNNLHRIKCKTNTIINAIEVLIPIELQE
jgi:indole-3-glycerol phosphate synthase